MQFQHQDVAWFALSAQFNCGRCDESASRFRHGHSKYYPKSSPEKTNIREGDSRHPSSAGFHADGIVTTSRPEDRYIRARLCDLTYVATKFGEAVEFTMVGIPVRSGHRRSVHATMRVLAGFDDLTFTAGVVAVVLAVIPTVAIFGMGLGLLGVVFAIAARESRSSAEELDHPARMWCGLGLSMIAVTLGLYQAFAAISSVLQTLQR